MPYANKIDQIEYLKKWRLNNPDYHKNWVNSNRERFYELCKQWRERNKDKIRGYMREHYRLTSKHKKRILKTPEELRLSKLIRKNRHKKKHPEVYTASHKRYYSIHKEERKNYTKKWIQTPAGRQSRKRQYVKRRSLGYFPINKYIKSFHAHHLNNNIVVFIPLQIHKLVYHSVTMNINLPQINKLALEYLFAIDELTIGK